MITDFIPAAACILVFLLPILAGTFDWTTAGTMAAVLLALGGFQLLLWWRQKQRVTLTPVLWGVLAFAALQALSLIGSVNRDASLKASGLSLAAAALTLLFSAAPPSSPERSNPRRLALQALGPCAALAAAVLWVSVQGWQEYLANYGFAPETRIFSTFYNPDNTAGFLAMALPICLALLWLELPPLLVPLLVVTSVMGSVALVLTGSKGGWLSLLVGLVAMAAVRLRIVPPEARSTSRWFLLAAGLSLLAALGFSHLLVSRIASANAAQAHSTLFRLLAWKSCLKMMLHRPLFGFGAGAFSQAYPRFAIGGPTEMAHSSYLQAGAECGILGLLALLAATFIAILPAFRRSRSQPQGPTTRPQNNHPHTLTPTHPYSHTALRSALLPGLAAGLVASGVHNLIDFDWSVPGLWLLFWALAGVLGGISPSIPEPSSAGEPRFKAPRAWAGLLVPGLGMALPLAAVLMGLFAASAYHESAARTALGLDVFSNEAPAVDPEKAVSLASTAISLDRLNAKLYVLRAQASQQQAQAPGPLADSTSLLHSAEMDLRTAARMWPTWALPLYRLGRLQESERRLAEAQTSYKQALDRDPHVLDAELRLAAIALQSKHPEEARQWLQRTADTESTPFARVRGVPEDYDPHYLEAWVGLAHLDASSGRWKECAAEAKHALDDLDEYARLARAYVRMQRIWTIYSPERRQGMVEMEKSITSILEEALSHLGRKAEIPALHQRSSRFIAAIAGIKDPPGQSGTSQE